MLDGKQSMSVFKDTRTLAAQVVKMVGQILKGETVDVNDTETYDNGRKVSQTLVTTRRSSSPPVTTQQISLSKA